MESLYQKMQEKVMITAEIGINHNGDLDTALALIAAAAECGADAAKFQAFDTDHMYSTYTPGFSHTENNVFEQIKRLEIKSDWWPVLKEACKKNNLYFSYSVFDSPTVKRLKRTKPDFIKIASSEIGNTAFIKEQACLSNTFVLSTGMSDLREITETVCGLHEAGIHKIVLLECTSAYPASPKSINLLNIDFLRDTFKLPVGFSDHSKGIHHAIAAVARGARFVEKHFTLDKGMAGPDHALSSDVTEFKQLTAAIREVETAMKENRKMVISEYEKETRQIGKKSLIATRDMSPGDLLTEADIVVKRPGLGIRPDEMHYALGRKLAKGVKRDMWIRWEDMDGYGGENG